MSGPVSQSDEAKKKWLEEYKELGQEYRYREQLMVQEFGISMVALGVIATRLWDASDVFPGVVVTQFVAIMFLAVLVLHLRHLNEDRHGILKLREDLRQQLEFSAFHLGTGGKRLSAPVAMIWFARTLLAIWAFWFGMSAPQLAFPGRVGTAITSANPKTPSLPQRAQPTAAVPRPAPADRR